MIDTILRVLFFRCYCDTDVWEESETINDGEIVVFPVLALLQWP